MRKRATRTTDPLDGPVDFARFGPVRRRAFAGAGEPGGPSLLALWEMPQLASGTVLLRRGHPGKGQRRTTVVRSVRLPDARAGYVKSPCGLPARAQLQQLAVPLDRLCA